MERRGVDSNDKEARDGSGRLHCTHVENYLRTQFIIIKSTHPIHAVILKIFLVISDYQ